jgi:hypothetical protein
MDQLTVFSILIIGTPLKKQSLEEGVKTMVPADYALSFDITEHGTSSTSSQSLSIIYIGYREGRQGK